MPKVVLDNQTGSQVGEIELSEHVFGVEDHQQAIFDTVIAEQAAKRQGTQKAKTRSEVSGGGRKPWRQKGTGHARQGSIRAVQWRGGGIAFGPTPRDYSKKMNRKERRLALKSALTSKFQDKELVIVENLNLADNKTKTFNEMLKNLKVDGKALVVYADENENLFLASRNNNKVAVVAFDEINVLDLVAASYLLIDESSVKKIEEVLN